jgi:hypothetical protein
MKAVLFFINPVFADTEIEIQLQKQTARRVWFKGLDFLTLAGFLDLTILLASFKPDLKLASRRESLFLLVAGI